MKVYEILQSLSDYGLVLEITTAELRKINCQVISIILSRNKVILRVLTNTGRILEINFLDILFIQKGLRIS